MKRIKKIGSIFLCITILCVTLGIEVLAVGPLDGQIVDGSLLTSDLEATDAKVLIPDNPFEEIVPYGNYLATGNAGIINEGNGVVYISGQTSCYETCDSVRVDLALERLSNGSWYTVSMHPHTEYNTYFASTGLYLAVAKGYYYRVRGRHIVTKGVSTESNVTCSNGIFID